MKSILQQFNRTTFGPNKTFGHIGHGTLLTRYTLGEYNPKKLKILKYNFK